MDSIILSKSDFKSVDKWNELIQRLHLEPCVTVIELELNGIDSVIDKG